MPLCTTTRTSELCNTLPHFSRPFPPFPTIFIYACSSELTCTDPTAVKDIEHTHDGLITFPLMPDRTKLVTVGVCEWTVTIVAEQPISETATLKGATNVIW